MYPVTEDFLSNIKADVRQVFAKVIIDYSDPFLDTSIEVSANEEANVSYPAQTADATEVPGKNWLSLDGTCNPDGTAWPAPGIASRGQMGWWGSQLADALGIYSPPYPTLTVAQDPRPARRLRVIGDSIKGEYPVAFVINLYDSGDVLVHTEIVSYNDAVEWSLDLDEDVLDVAKKELVIFRWSHAGRQAKILEFYSSISETYESEDLTGLCLLEEREAMQGSIPVGNISANEITIYFDNSSRKFDEGNEESPLKGLLKPNRRIQAFLGIEVDEEIEYVPLGVFWSLDWDSAEDTVEASVTARDLTETLRSGTYLGTEPQSDVSLYSLAEQVLQDAGLYSSEYSIDSALSSIIVPWGWFPKVTHREALRLIVEAALSVCYVSREGVVTIEAFVLSGGSSVLEITNEDYFTLSNPSKRSEVANEITVVTQPLEQETETSVEVYRSPTPVTIPAESSVEITVTYSSSPIIDAEASLDTPPGGVSITDETYYAWGVVVTIENTNITTQEATIVVDGIVLSVQGSETIVASDADSIRDNGILSYEFPDNHLVQLTSQAESIASTLLASTKDHRRDIELPWRGNPAVVLGDRVTVKDIGYYVIRQNINWNGALDATMTGRKCIE